MRATRCPFWIAIDRSQIQIDAPSLSQHETRLLISGSIPDLIGLSAKRRPDATAIGAARYGCAVARRIKCLSNRDNSLGIWHATD
jgi:hypothetical protein